MVDVKSFLSFTLDDVEEYAQSLNCPERLGVGPSIVLPNGDVYDLTSVNLDGDATHFTFFHLIFDSLAQDLRDEYPDDEDIDYEIYKLDDDRRIMDYVESDLGIITLNEGRTYVEPRAKLVALKKPTDAQYEVIEEYLDEVQKYKSVVFCFLTEKSDYVSYRFYENTTDEIIEKIKRTFAFGRVFEGVSNKKTLYRDGQVDDWSNGLFFADDLRYYDYNDNFDAEDTRAYEVDFSNVKIFDPMKEWDLYVNTWSDIRQTKEFFDEKGFDYYEYLDDVDYDEADAYHEVITDTDALASYAKEHNYDAVVFRDIHSDGGRGPAFNEYCIFNKDIVKSKTITESSKESTHDKTGREYNIWTECTGGYSGQSDYMKIAYVGDNWMDEHDRIIRENILGYLQYSVADDEEDIAYIQMIEVKESERRKGIATALIDSLKKEYKEINWGYTTNDGTKFYNSYNKINESRDTEDRLKQVHHFKHLQEYIETNEFKLGTAGYIKEDGLLIILDEYHGEDKELQKIGYPEFSNTHAEEDTCVRIFNEPNEIQYKKLEEIIDTYLDVEDYCKIEIWKNNKPDFYKIFTLHEGACDYVWEQETGMNGNWTGYKLVRVIKNYFHLNEKIVKKGTKWQVQSEKGRNMGIYDTKAEAEKRLKQVHYFKHVNEDKEDYQKKFDERTHAHIDRVNKYAKKINKEYPHHDEDKFNELYAGYSLMSKNKEDITKEEQAMIDDATFKHVINNEHHCEHWVDPKDIEGFSRDNPTPHGCLDCSKMPESALEEMCCDWCAMSEEFGNTPFEWYEKNKDTRWHFNEEQDKFILDTLHKLWDTEKITEDLQETDNEGNVLSKEQIEFFKNSKVRDEQGRLIVCYHGTDKEFDVFDKELTSKNGYSFYGKGFYFTLNGDNDYGKIKKKCYLNIKNPMFSGRMWIDYCKKYGKEWFQYPNLTKQMLEDGYDGIISKDTNSVVAFESNQIKSIDNKNPTNSDNINEDLQETDDEGNPLSKEQIAFFKDSSIRDNDGKLLVVYHGTDKNFDKFARGDIGFHFGTKGQATAVANEFPSNTGKVGAYYLNIKNPAFMYDFGDTGPISTLFWWWSQSFDEYGSIFDFDMTEDELKQINDVLSVRGVSFGTGAETDIGDDAEAEDFDSSLRHADMYNSPESRLLRKLLKARGYDGIYYQNNFEDSDSINGDISYIAFDANQIKSIDNKNPTNSDNVNEGSSGVPNKQKYQNKKLKKNIVKIAKERGFNGIIDTKELSVHHLSDVYENGLKDNSYKNIWFIKSKDWKDRELLHKLLHYMDRNEVSYQELLDKLEEIKLYQYDDVNNEFIEKTLSVFRESLTESKQDSENFKKWLDKAYEEVGYQWSSPEIDVSDYMSNADACYSLFQSYRKDNSGKETDYYYWMKREPDEFFSFLARYARKNKDKRELIDKENSGAERIAENNFWYVYKITSYEASRKYGRNTTWCITDEYDWNSYRDNWGIEYFLFFIPKDDSKYMRHAVGVSDNEVQMIFNQEDCKVEGIPNVPRLPSGYPQIEDAMNKDFYSYFDVSDDITEANLRDAAEAGVNWLDYLWFLRNDEDEIKDILQNDFHIDMNESLTEAKADTERFLKWISDGYKSMKYSDWASGVYAKEAVNVFNKYKNSLKGEQRDIYAWMKKPFSDFASLISSLKKRDDEKAEVARKEDEGAELVYESDDWFVYKITTYEASVKYGKGTKWCISGSKRWENGKNGREHWDNYHNNGIFFYFFINRKSGRKYAIAIYPDFEHYEIFNDADIAITYIPDAPFVKQVANSIIGRELEAWYAEVNPEHEIQSLIAEGKVDFDFIKPYLNDCDYNYTTGTLTLYNNVDEFVNGLDRSIPDEYLEWEAVTDGKMSVEQYKKLTGYDYEEEWVGDVPQLSNWDELKNWEKGKEAALDKSNFDSGFYLIADDGDSEELWSYHKDLPDALLEFSRYSPRILDEITERIFTDLESGSVTVNDFFTAFRLSEDTKDNLKQTYESLSLKEELVYHGSIDKGLKTLDRPTNWVTSDFDYAKYYATSLKDEGSVYTLDIELSNLFDVGNTGLPVYLPLPFGTPKPTSETIGLAKKLNLSDEELNNLLNEVLDEFGLTTTPNKLRLSTVVRSLAFKKILVDKGYSGVSAIEFNVPKNRYCRTYGIFDELEPIDEQEVRYDESLDKAHSASYNLLEKLMQKEDNEMSEDIEKHDELNQKLFDGDELRQDVKDKVVEIANAFVDELKADGIKFNLKDIVLIGSNVNYNYTKDSDLDIHLIADSDGLECPDELYPLLYSAYRSIFNKNYEIKIKGIPAEIYVEMDEPQGVSNGIYSIENGWVKKPVQTDIPDIDREKLDDELSKWEDKYFELRDRIEYALASTEHPLDESFKVRKLSEEYVDEDKEIFTTESPYEVANMLRSSEKALRILYDRKLKRFFVCDADELIHREMVDAAWERGYYAQLAQSGVLRGKWELDSYLDDYGGHVIYYIYAPLDKVADTYGSEVNEDGYEGKYVYDFGVVTTRSDDKYKSSPLGKALGKYEHHYVQDGWIDDYTPKIIEVA